MQLQSSYKEFLFVLYLFEGNKIAGGVLDIKGELTVDRDAVLFKLEEKELLG